MFSQSPLMGSDEFVAHTLEIVIMLFVAFLLGFIIAFILRKMQSGSDHHQMILRKELEDSQKALKSVLDSENTCTLALSKLKSVNKELKQQIETAIVTTPVETAIVTTPVETAIVATPVTVTPIVAPVAAKKAVLSDAEKEKKSNDARLQRAKVALKDSATVSENLESVKGIGPAINILLHKHGVDSFLKLSTASMKQLEDIIKLGGDRFLLHSPITWSLQAKMIHEKRWDDLEDYWNSH